MARTKEPKTKNAWFRPVLMGGRKSCPTCKAKLDGESIWTLGEYIRVRWHTVEYFCRQCFPNVRVGIESAERRNGCTYEYVGQHCTLPDWLCPAGQEPYDPEAGFWNAIDAHPGDILRVAVLADYLQERNDPRGAGIRWAADGNRVPDRRKPPEEHYCDWWWAGVRGQDERSWVPGDIYFALRRTDDGQGKRVLDPNGVPGTYGKESEAYRDLAETWARVRGETNGEPT